MKTSKGIPFASLPPHLQRQVLEQDAQRKSNLAALPVPTPNLDKIIRQSSGKLNKTEQRFLDWLNEPKRYVRVLSQAWTWKIGNGVRYTPDFITVDKHAVYNPRDEPDIYYRYHAWEVKGFLRDDAAVKIKVAAREYPEIEFTLVWWDRKSRDWKFQTVLP